MKAKKYLPLSEVTNLYSQFSALSPKDKIIANKQTKDRSDLKRENKNKKLYIIVGSNNYWYATTDLVTPKELVKVVNDTLKMIKKGGMFYPEPPFDTTELFAYPVGEAVRFEVD